MKILLADDHALFREGMGYILRRLDEQVEILEAGNFPAAFNTADVNPDLDLALLDFDMPGSEGVSSIQLFRERYPNIPIVVISGTDQRDNIERVLNNGAKGFISKMSSGQDMVNALRLVLDGGFYLPPQLLSQAVDQVKEDKRRRTSEFCLTERQIEVLRHLGAGLSNRDIGLALGLAEGTVKAHVASILQTLRVNRRMEAVETAKRMGLLVEATSN